MKKRNETQVLPTRRFVSEADVEVAIGISRRTLQKHRLFKTGFPYYKAKGRVLYDLDEVESIIRASRVDGGPAA